jgi:hypothetical protein
MEMEGDWIILSQVGVVDCVNLDWQVQEENTEEQKQDCVPDDIETLLNDIFNRNTGFLDYLCNANMSELTLWGNDSDLTDLDELLKQCTELS